MRLFLPLIIFLSISSCQTVAEDIPVCDPNKMYIQPIPPVCKKIAECPETKRLGLPYNKRDESHFESAKLRCVEHFPTKPCLKVFKKIEKNRYTAICGEIDGMGTMEVLIIRGSI